jgi:hypothetical protein
MPQVNLASVHEDPADTLLEATIGPAKTDTALSHDTLKGSLYYDLCHVAIYYDIAV